MGVSTSGGFAGRLSEMGTLTGVLDEALAGSGRLVVIGGEAGVGKTRLCEEFSAIARHRGARVAWVACWDAAGLPPYWPWRQLVEQLEAADPFAIDAASPDVARAQLGAAVTRWLRTAARQRPLAMVVDDVQWADEGTASLLAHVAPLLRSMPVLLVATMRDPATARSTLPRDLIRHARPLDLQGLGLDELADLVETVSGSRPVDESVRTLHRLTAGNPLFATELVRHLSSTGGLDQLSTADELPVPPSVRAVLGERLAALGETCRQLLDIGAVAGSEFRVGLVAEVSGRTPGEVIAHLQEAADAGVILAHGIDQRTFAHPLLRSVLRDDIGVARRMGIHASIAGSLERVAGRQEDLDLAALSYHYLNAPAHGTAGKAAQYAELAARAAMRALGYADAAELFDRALAAHELDPGRSDRTELLLGSGEAHLAGGDAARSRRAFLAAADEARARRRGDQLAAAALGLAGSGFEVALFDEQHIELLDEALAVIGDDQPGVRSRLCARLSVALSLGGSDSRRAARSGEAVRLAEAADEPLVLAHALAARHDAHAGPEHVGARAADAATIIRIARDRHDHGTELLGRRLRLVVSLELGEIDTVEAETRVCVRLSDRLRQPRFQWYTRLWRATLATMRGRFDEQDAFATEAESLGLAAGSANAPILVFTHRWLTWVETGEVERALAHADAHAPPGTWAEWGPQMVPWFAQRALIAGRPDDARAVLDGAGDSLRDLARDSEWLTTMAHVADVCFQLGGHDLVPWLQEAMEPFARLWAVDGIAAYSVGCVGRHLGALAALQGRNQIAARHFDAALAAHRRAGAELLVARTLRDRGVALGHAESLRAARAAYAGLGVARRAAEVEALLTGVRTVASSVATPPQPSRFVRVGDSWTVCHHDRQLIVRDSKGVRDLARLLSQPGREVHSLDLAAPHGHPPAGDAGPSVDAQARAAYRARLRELELELDDSDIAQDTERSVRALAERDALLQQLAGAYGLGGRGRPSGDAAERARTAVTARIRDAIRRIGAHHPDLGRHLARSVRTGAFCVYDPDPPVTWTV